MAVTSLLLGYINVALHRRRRAADLSIDGMIVCFVCLHRTAVFCASPRAVYRFTVVIWIFRMYGSGFSFLRGVFLWVSTNIRIDDEDPSRSLEEVDMLKSAHTFSGCDDQPSSFWLQKK